jgi:hypothetical protein
MTQSGRLQARIWVLELQLSRIPRSAATSKPTHRRPFAMRARGNTAYIKLSSSGRHKVRIEMNPA